MAPVPGQVIEVLDAQTLRLSRPGQPPLLVRLRDIVAPTPCQAGGEEARQALAGLALHQGALFMPSGRDSQGRTVGRVVVDEVDLSQRMVEEGEAFSIRSHWDQGPLVKQERMAHALGRGLHAVAGVAPPPRTQGPLAACESAAPRP